MNAILPMNDLRRRASAAGCIETPVSDRRVLTLSWQIAESGRPTCVWVAERVPDGQAR